MARLFADEDFPLAVANELRRLGHDVITTPDARRAGQRIPDPDQLSFAQTDARAIMTLNRRDFVKLHRNRPEHAGIITCTVDADTTALAMRIDAAIRHCESLAGRLIRVVRPNLPRSEA